MPQRKRQHERLSVFKGREAKLNRAIFQTLAPKEPKTIYDIHKQIRTQRGLKYTRYASVNKRVRSLEKSGYIKKIGVKKTKAGFKASIYELTARAYLTIILDSVNLEDLLVRVNEATASAILATIAYTT